MSLRFATIRRFRFNPPQRIAAGLLVLFLAQCFWLTAHQTLSERDYQYARCGRDMWERPSPLAGYFTSCGNIHDGVLAYRLAGLPLTLNVFWERVADNFRKPEDKVMQTLDASASTWELRHQMTHVLLLLRLPFLAAGVVLGAALWWVSRRLFGNWGGYTALTLYVFSPAILRASITPNPEILTAVGFFGGLYTCIGVAHAMQGPKSKWRPRIVLLTLAFGFTAAAHVSAFLLGLVLAIAFMAYVAEGRRAYLPTLVIVWVLGALFLLFASYAFRPDAFSYVFRSDAASMGFSLNQAAALFSSLTNAGITIAAVAALGLYLAFRRSRYFGNTTPLLVAALLLVLVTTGVQTEIWLWALPFLLAFIGGVFADVLETRYRKIFLWVTSAMVLAQAALCVAGLPLLAQ